MGIHGLLPQLGPPPRISLAKLSSTHYTAHSRPLRLAIDISIWLFQIQAGKGGSNPALRTFYYRLLRLLALNIHPLFVFDGPNKPTFKRHKKVGGPGARVASVPEFLAKQLLKQFGFPWHVAPGEAEAECALLQREGVVDAVLSEDVDTLMFGSGVTVRNWTSENATKSPTHVDVYRAEETRERSRGLDREGMVLVALMSGGDYLPEGIPGCGPKVACDAARAGFGRELCALSRKDALGMKEWKERLQHEIRSNESHFFSRKNTTLTIPDDFPNREVLGYYTHPCISTADKLARLKQELRWDQPIDFAALRTFTADAFDWRCRGGAKKFIKNLAPAMLVRELRPHNSSDNNNNNTNDPEAQEHHERKLVQAIHSKRNHNTTDGELEYRISFLPSTLVPIDLSLEEEDDQFIPAGGAAAAAAAAGWEEKSDAESESVTLPSSSNTPAPDDDVDDAASSPSKKKKKKEKKKRIFDPAQPEKIWILKTFLQIGCPLLVEDYEASFKDPKEFLKARKKARLAAAAAGRKDGGGDICAAAPRAKKKGGGKEGNGMGKGKGKDMPENALMEYTRVTKVGSGGGRGVLGDVSSNARGKEGGMGDGEGLHDGDLAGVAAFRMPATQIPAELLRESAMATATSTRVGIEVLDLAVDGPAPISGRPFTAFAAPKKTSNQTRATKAARTQNEDLQKTPRRNEKRASPDLSSPAMSQRTITSYYSPSPRKPNPSTATATARQDEIIINLISSSPAPISRPLTPTPPNTRFRFIREDNPSARLDFSPGKLPNTVTKRRKKTPLKRWQTEPVLGQNDEDDEEALPPLPTPTSREGTPIGSVFEDSVGTGKKGGGIVEAMEIISSSPAKGGGFLVEDLDNTPRSQRDGAGVWSSPPPSPRREERKPEVEEKVDWWFSGVGASDNAGSRADAVLQAPSCTVPTPLDRAEDNLTAPRTAVRTAKKAKSKDQPSTSLPFRPSPQKETSKKSALQPVRRSPRQQAKKKRIELRESLEGWWKEVDAEAVDMSGDGSGWKRSGGRAEIVGWRKSGVEVLDLTGA